MKHKLLLLLTLFTFLASFNCYAENITFETYSKQILNIKSFPTNETHTTKILVLHPLVKEKVTELLVKSNIVWKDGKGVKTIKSFQQLKGKPVKGKTGIGESFNYAYISKKLKEFCLSTKLSDWRKDNKTLKLDKINVPGYRFNVIIGGKTRDAAVYTDDKGGLVALYLGYLGGKINIPNNSSDSCTVWYFSKKDGKLTLDKTTKVTTEKKSGIPFIKTDTTLSK